MTIVETGTEFVITTEVKSTDPRVNQFRNAISDLACQYFGTEWVATSRTILHDDDPPDLMDLFWENYAADQEAQENEGK